MHNRHGVVGSLLLLGLWVMVAVAQTPPVTIGLVGDKGHYQPHEPVRWQITIANVSGAEILARSGFFEQTFERQVRLVDPDGQPVATRFTGATDEPGPPVFVEEQGTSQAATLVEVIPAGAQRVLVIADARYYYPLTKPGRYTAQVITSLETFSETIDDPITGARYGKLNDPGRQGFDPLESNPIAFVLEVLAGDVNGDGRVDCNDLNTVRAARGLRLGQVGFEPRADLNQDGLVDGRDIVLVSRRLPAGTNCPVR